MTLLEELLSRYETPQLKKAATLAVDYCKDLKWVPNPGPQTLAYDSLADELFYGGAAGGGKTDLIAGLALNLHKRTLILRREGTDLRGIEQRFVEIIGNDDGYNKSRREWRVGDGQTVELGACQHEGDKLSYQGRPHDLKAFDEICQFTKTQYQYITAWNRSATPGQRCRIVCAGNPPQTPEGYWVKEAWAPWLDPTFENPAKPGELRCFTTDPESGETVWVDKDWVGIDDDGNEIHPRSRTFVPALLSDNPELPESYRSNIQAMPEPLRSQLLYGDFTKGEKDQINQVIPTAWIREAQQRWRDNPPTGKERMISIGVDMAQGGNDKTVFAPRYEGRTIGELKRYAGQETPDGPTASALLMKEWRDKAALVIDMGGGYGQSTYDHLKDNGISAFKFNGADGSDQLTPQGLKYRNRRAEAWWKMRMALDPGGKDLIKLPPDERLTADLATPKWELTPQGIKIESKEDIRKRIGRSPDDGDAVVQAFFHPKTDAKPKPRRRERKKPRSAWAA